MHASDIRDLSTEEILNKMDTSRRELWNLRIAFYTNTLENPNQIRLLRKDMARMLTVLRERDLAAEYVQATETTPAQPQSSRKLRTPAPSTALAVDEAEVTAAPMTPDAVTEEEGEATHGE